MAPLVKRILPLALALAAGLGACLLLGACAGARDQGAQTQDPTNIVESGQGATGDGQGDDASGKKADAAKGTGSRRSKSKEGTDGKASGLTVFIDAGHGSKLSTKTYRRSPGSSETGMVQPLGTSGSKSGNEYEVNLKVAKLLKADLEAAGASVVMVRTTNDVVISPKERAERANESGADVCVRLHCDSAGKGTEGFLTLLPAKSGYQAQDGLYKKSQRIGRAMHKSIVKTLGANDRGCVLRSDQGGFNWCKIPCVLFEMGNMDNAADDERLASKVYLQKMAQAIADACTAYGKNG